MRPALAVLIFSLCAVLSGWALLEAAGAGEVEVEIGLDAWRKIEPKVAALQGRPASDAELRVIFLGDSTTLRPAGAALPSRLQRALQAHAGRLAPVQVNSLGFSGMNAFDYYSVSEPVQRAAPARIVMNFNLAAFSEPVRAYFSRPELAAWIPPRRWHRAAVLPFHWQGLTFDSLLLRSTIVTLGLDDLWHALLRQGVRLQKAYEKLSLHAQGRKQPLGGPFTAKRAWILGENSKKDRPQRADQILVRYGAALGGVPSDHPVLRMLHAAVSEYVSVGMPVTVYTNPINIDQIDGAGLDRTTGLPVTIENVRIAVESAGGYFVDLHAMLPNDAFRDPAGHLEVGSTATVARALARAIAMQPDWQPARAPR